MYAAHDSFVPAHQLFHCDEGRETNLSFKREITKIHFQNGSVLKSVLYNEMFLEQAKTTKKFDWLWKSMYLIETSFH